MAEIINDFILGASIESRLTAWYGEGYGGYSHVAPLLTSGPHVGMYCDARSNVVAGVPAGVQLRNPESETWVKKVKATLQVSSIERDEYEANLLQRVGAPYGHRDIWGFMTGKPMHEGGHWICSAHAVDALQHIKRVVYPLPVAAHEITPNSLLLLCAQAGFKFVWLPIVGEM
jgi:hypothetical protein